MSLEAIRDEDVIATLQRLCTESLVQIEQEKYSFALLTLQQLEDLYSIAQTRMLPVDSHICLLTHHNAAHCCQHSIIQSTPICIGKNAQSFPDSVQSERFRTKHYEYKVNIQLCGLLSQTEKHMAALMHAKVAARAAHALVTEALAMCQRLVGHLKGTTSAAFSLTEFDQTLTLDPSVRSAPDTITTARSVLEYLDCKMRGKVTTEKPPKINMRSNLGVQRYSDWIYSFAIADLMRVNSLTLFELKNQLNPITELARDKLIEKVCMLIVAYYCVAMELRQQQGDGLGKAREAQLWHFRSLEIAQDLLPMECALVEHIRASYHQNYVLNYEKTGQVRARSASANLTGRRGNKDGFVSSRGSPYSPKPPSPLQSKSPSARIHSRRLLPSKPDPSPAVPQKTDSFRHIKYSERRQKDTQSRTNRRYP